ncbi:class F sortase [Amycolatopsis sp. FBCC-B4732]|uniref:class F sortase n=1 Tax=unclassified Amycolatopsis TaxID=2618356 RepID=UPI001FF61F48|nr:class F sortase [Amycolatopsis sp. FBCC-B4732]UOX89794.1 class F sortase [Amycolatopsis sp. FBCC-B4732]
MLRTALAAVAAALAVAAFAAGIVLLTWLPPTAAPLAAPPPGSLPGENAAPAVLPADSESAAQQRPGTVRLPDGATARLVRTELTDTGVLPIPRGLGDAAWWGAKLGADRGTALLSGHVNWEGQRGPFDELWRTRAGDEVSIVDARGGRWVYRVDQVVTLAKEALPQQAQSWFNQSGPHRLVLVTCGGDYVGGTEGYDENRLVTANLVTRPPG